MKNPNMLVNCGLMETRVEKKAKLEEEGCKEAIKLVQEDLRMC